MQAVIGYVTAAVVFLACDALWLGVIAKNFYREKLGAMMLEKPLLGAAAVFYLLYVVGLLVFIILPQARDGSWKSALGFGALFGLVAYATYDMSNLATLRDWSTSLSVVDMAWGAFATAVACAAATAVVQRFA